MADNSARCRSKGELKLTETGCMGGEAEADKFAGESTVPLTRILDIATVRPGIGGKSGVDVGSFGEEGTDLGFRLLKKQRVSSALPTEGGKVDPMSGERSGEEDDKAAEIEQCKAQIKKLEGELQHYQLRVAGVAALVNMLNEKKEEASQWKEKSQRLETALSRMEHKAGKLEKELRDRSAGSEESGRRMAPVLPPNKQLLNKLARDNARLQMALNRLMGKGIYSYQEGLTMADLERVIEEQAQTIKVLQQHLQKLREGHVGTQTHSSDKLPDSGIGPSMSFTSTSAPASLSGNTPEVASLKSEVLSMEEKLLKREHFIVTLAEKLAEYQARDRQAQPVSSFSGAQSLPVVVSRAAGEPEPPEGKSGTTQTQESIDSMEESDAKIRQLEQEVAQGKQRLEELSAHLSATHGELEVARRKCKVAEEEAHTIRERAQVHFGTDVSPYMTEITHLRKMVGRLSKQVQEQNQQLTEQNEELNKIKSDPEMVTAKDRVVEQLKDENERLRRDIEEADIKMKSLKSDKDVVDELREKADELEVQVRKLKVEKRVLSSQCNDAKSSHEATLTQITVIYDILRQRNFWDPRLPQTRLRQDRYMASPMVTDGMRSGGSRSEYQSFIQTPHVRTVEARGINQPPDSVPQYPSSGGHARPPQPSQQLRPYFVQQSQQQLSGQEFRYSMTSRDQYSHLAGSRDRLSLSLAVAPQHASAGLAQSHPQMGPEGTPPLPFGRTAHFVQTPEMSGSTGYLSHSRSGAVSPGTPGRFVAEREQSGSGPSYEAYSRNPYHRQ